MISKKHLGVGLFLALIISAGLGSMWYTMHRLKNDKEFVSSYDQEIERIEKAKGKTITLTETKAGHRKWVLKMKSIEYNKDNSLATLKDIKGLVYGDKQKVLITVVAPNGEYRKDTNQIMLKDGVKMLSPATEMSITADRMEWSTPVAVSRLPKRISGCPVPSVLYLPWTSRTSS
jgi:LPS export ABC transporter protein LptC